VRISLSLGFVSGLIRLMTCCVKFGSYLLLLLGTALASLAPLVPFVAMMGFVLVYAYERELIVGNFDFTGAVVLGRRGECEGGF
jgi:hypothetical protein